MFYITKIQLKIKVNFTFKKQLTKLHPLSVKLSM